VPSLAIAIESRGGAPRAADMMNEFILARFPAVSGPAHAKTRAAEGQLLFSVLKKNESRALISGDNPAKVSRVGF
jgi:hypothetical protein